MGAFASDVAQLPRIVTLNDLAITNDKGVLAMDAVAKTFRYLDEDEIAKQRGRARREGKGEGQEMKRAARGIAGRAARRSRAAAARATRTCARGWPSRARARAGKLDPLPQIKPYEPFAYNAFDLPDPFKPRKIEPTKGGEQARAGPRAPPEPLEAFPLESLTMVGTLEKNKTMYALVRTPDKDVYQVRAGNYLGQNFGVIIGISDSEIKLEGARAGRRRRLDRAHRARCSCSRPDTKTQGRKR